MLIVHLRFPITPEDRPKALEAFTRGAGSVRAMKGCVAFFPFYDPDDEGVLGVLHEWESEEEFAAYATSDIFKEFGTFIRPMMTGKPVSRRFRAELIEVVN